MQAMNELSAHWNCTVPLLPEMFRFSPETPPPVVAFLW